MAARRVEPRDCQCAWVCGPPRAVSAAAAPAHVKVGGRAAAPPTPPAHVGAGRPATAPRGEPKTDPAVEKALAGLTTVPDECAEGLNRRTGEPCASKPVLAAVSEFVREQGGAASESAAAPAVATTPARADSNLLPTAPTPEAEAVRAAAAELGCTSESCVLTHPRFLRAAGPGAEKTVRRDLNTRFKARGPRTGKDLTSNFNLDETLQRWARTFPEFYPCPFAMMDFESNGDLFGEIDLPDVLDGRVPTNLGPDVGRVARPATCFGCVLNTDTSRGPGKHWVAVFVDCRGLGDTPWTVEYFNSAGRPPDRPVVRWMERTRARLEAVRGGPVLSVAVTDLAHQESQTECGLYALFYIRRRLEGAPYSLFREDRIPDEAMTAFREHVFRAR